MQNFHSMYKLTKFIGSGFRSKIYTCKDLQSGKYFACKIVAGDNVNKTKSDENISINCEHENINKIQQVVYNRSDEGVVTKYIISELGEGDIFDYIEQQNFKLCENTVKHIIKQMTKAINYLHKKNICHRDIKLENFIYSKINSNESNHYNNIKVKLIDFEFAVDCNKFEMTGRTGTKSYIAPELYNSKKYDTKVDIWSLGICSYMMLSNKNPFNHYKKCNENIDFNIDLNSFELKYRSDESIDFLHNLLQCDPKNRFNSEEVLNHKWLIDV